MSDTNAQDKPFKALKAAEKQQAIYELCQEILQKVSGASGAPAPVDEQQNKTGENDSGS